MPHQANDTEPIRHDHASAGDPERPTGAGTDGSMRATIASSGPLCCGRAWQAGRAHGGSAGVAGRGRADGECQGVDGFLQAMADDLQGGSDQPQPGRRGYIPQPDGRPRPLGIPTGRECVGQQACQVVIEPRVAATCQDPSDGVRPKRRAAQAGNRVQEHLGGGWSGVAADIAASVAPMAPAGLLSLVTRRSRDRRVLKRLRHGLPVGVLEEGRGQATAPGCPQGGAAAPC